MPDQAAQIQEVLLRRGALPQLGLPPLGDEILGRDTTLAGGAVGSVGMAASYSRPCPVHNSHLPRLLEGDVALSIK